jgi:hypothetical protein
MYYTRTVFLSTDTLIKHVQYLQYRIYSTLYGSRYITVPFRDSNVYARRSLKA